MNPIRILYFGTSSFAVPALQSLVEHPNDFSIVGVVTQPDKPTGRKKIIKSSPVALFARSKNLPLFQIDRLKSEETFSLFQKINPDIIIVAAYGKIIPEPILSLPKFGSLNLHGSLLPQYRGASPIQEALLRGDAVTGVTLMLMDSEIDHGAIIDDVRVPINDRDTKETLEKTMGEAAAKLLLKNINPYIQGDIKPKDQDHTKATFTRIIKKEDGLVSFTKQTALEIERKLRAYTPWPGIFTLLPNNVRLRILDVSISPSQPNMVPGTVFVINKKPAVQTKEGVIILEKVQKEGKQETSGANFLLGNQSFINTILSEH